MIRFSGSNGGTQFTSAEVAVTLVTATAGGPTGAIGEKRILKLMLSVNLQSLKVLKYVTETGPQPTVVKAQTIHV